jgi:hypothetical protein
MMKYESLGVTAVLVVLSGAAFPHEGNPPVDETPAIAAMRYCQTTGVRAAWGAQARFLGAPAVFRYIPEAPLRKMFGGEVSDIPTDAIYVLEDLDLRQRREYEEAAFFGWKQADRWVRDGRQRPAYEMLTALFYHGCKQSLTAEAKEEQPAAEYNSGFER